MNTKDMPTLKFYLKAGRRLQSGDELLGSGGNVMKMAGNAKDWSESPTTDGKQSERVHVKSTHDNRHDLAAMAKTERYEITHAIALVTNALDDNPDEQVKEPESMIGSSEFYQSNNPQVIEPWVGDQLEDLINPVSEGCQAGVDHKDAIKVMTSRIEEIDENYDSGMRQCVKDISRLIGLNFGVDVGYANLADEVESVIENLDNKATFRPLDFGAIPGEPVFTQEQADAGIIPPVGMRAMFYVEEKDVNAWFPGLVCGEFMGKAVARLDDSEVEGYFDDYSADQCKPIDNRSDKEKLHDGLYGFVSGYVACGQQEDIDDYVRELLSKFTITLKD